MRHGGFLLLLAFITMSETAFYDDFKNALPHYDAPEFIPYEINEEVSILLLLSYLKIGFNDKLLK